MSDRVGRYSIFQHGYVYRSPRTPAVKIEGAIFDRWGAIGWENSALGYPGSDEHDNHPGRASDFEYGTIAWTPERGALITSFLGQITSALTATDVVKVDTIGQDFSYDDNDEYYAVTLDANGDALPETPISKAQVEDHLQAGAVAAVEGYPPDPADSAVFFAVTQTGGAATGRARLAKQLRAAH